MWEAWVQSLSWEDMGKGMATQSSIAWRILGTEGPGGATVHEIAESGTLSNQPSTRAVTVLLAPGRLFPQKILSS